MLRSHDLPNKGLCLDSGKNDLQRSVVNDLVLWKHLRLVLRRFPLVGIATDAVKILHNSV